MKITGRARIFGIAGAATYTSFPATAAWVIQGASVGQDFEVKNILNDPATLKPISIAFGREYRDLSLEIIVAGAAADATQTVAEAAAVAVLPTAPFKVTLSGFSDADMNSGNWIYMGGVRKSYTPEGDARLTLPLRLYTELSDAEVTALVTTAA